MTITITLTLTITITITSCYEGEDSSYLVGGGGGARIPCSPPSAHGLYRPLCPSPCSAVPPALRHIPWSGWVCEYSEQEEIVLAHGLHGTQKYSCNSCSKNKIRSICLIRVQKILKSLVLHFSSLKICGIQEKAVLLQANGLEYVLFSRQ